MPAGHMNSILLIFFSLSLVLHALVSQDSSTPNLPPEVISALDERFPHWRFPEVSDEIRDFLKKNVAPDARPEFIEGDFNGDGKLDCAVLIEQGAVPNESGETIGYNVYIAAFMKRNAGYKLYVMGGNEYVTLVKKGDKDYDYETGKTFTYDNDAIFTGIFEKAGTSYIFENGKFRAIITSD